MGLASDFYTGLMGTLLVAPGLAGSMIMPFPVMSEIIDEDAQKHGFRREGLFFGMNSGITKLAFSAQGVMFASIMSAAGYVAGEAVQSSSAVAGIRFMISGTTIVANLLIALCMWKYPLGRERHNTVIAELAND
jgi:GPH family glycoside/pentoside/hexuronide:cation symporter